MLDADLSRCVRSVLALGQDLDATSIADVLWLAAVTSATGTADRSSASNVGDLPSAQGDAGLSGERPPTALKIAEQPGKAAPPQSTGTLAGTGELARGRRVRVERAQALPRPLELAWSLRPFKRRWPNGRRLRLDIDATVRSYARTWQLVPEFRRAPEPWFEVDLVIDDSPSMTVWNDAVAGLATLLHQLGAFRSIRTWQMSLSETVPLLRNEGGQPAGANQLRAPDGRRLIIVVSDGSAGAWFHPEVWQIMRTWAASTPTALISPLATRLWRRTGLALPAVRAGPATPGSPNPQLRYSVPYLLRAPNGDGEWMPLPAATLSPHMLGQWARTLMRGDPRGCDALLIPSAGYPYEDEAEDQDGQPSGRDLVEAFRRTASPEAARLAVLCAPFAAVSLPLLQLISQELVPNAWTGDLAEVIVGGLFLPPASTQHGEVFHFREGVQAHLQELLAESDAWRAYEVLQRHITTDADLAVTFAAAVYDPLGDIALPADLQPFAMASREALEFLGAVPTIGIRHEVLPEAPVTPPERAESTGVAQQLMPALRELFTTADRARIRALATTAEDASDSAVAEALSASHVPSWPLLASTVRKLGGDEEEFRTLWEDATAESVALPKADGQSIRTFLTNYRDYMAHLFGRLTLADFERQRQVLIDEVYVSSMIISAGETPSRELASQQFDREIYRTVLLGDPGSGKSTLCNFLMHRHAISGKLPIAFLITLRDFVLKRSTVGSVLKYIEGELKGRFQLSPPDGVIEGLFLTGRALVIFDGLDELPELRRRAEVTMQLMQFSFEYPLTRVLVTSRLIGYDPTGLDDSSFTAYRLAKFSDDQVAEYVHKWFSRAEGASTREAERMTREFMAESAIVADLRVNPLMLSLMCTLYRGAGFLPRNRPEIYEQSARLLFDRWDARRGIGVHDLRAGNLLEPVLRHLAWWLLTRDRPERVATQHELVNEITAYLQERRFESEPDARVAAEELVQLLRGRAWVFTEVGTTTADEALYSFTHRAFLEYFAAAYLASTSNSPEDLAKNLALRITSPEWEVIGQIAIQIEDRNYLDGGQRTLMALLNRSDWTDDDRVKVLNFVTGCALIFDIPSLIHRPSD